MAWCNFIRHLIGAGWEEGTTPLRAKSISCGSGVTIIDVIIISTPSTTIEHKSKGQCMTNHLHYVGFTIDIIIIITIPVGSWAPSGSPWFGSFSNLPIWLNVRWHIQVALSMGVNPLALCTKPFDLCKPYSFATGEPPAFRYSRYTLLFFPEDVHRTSVTFESLRSHQWVMVCLVELTRKGFCLVPDEDLSCAKWYALYMFRPRTHDMTNETYDSLKFNFARCVLFDFNLNRRSDILVPVCKLSSLDTLEQIYMRTPERIQFQWYALQMQARMLACYVPYFQFWFIAAHLITLFAEYRYAACLFVLGLQEFFHAYKCSCREWNFGLEFGLELMPRQVLQISPLF